MAVMTRWWSKEERIEFGLMFAEMHRSGISSLAIGREFNQSNKRVEKAMRSIGYDPSTERHNRAPRNAITEAVTAGNLGRRNVFGFHLIEQNSIPEPNSGCWLWDGTCTAKGYGTITINYQMWPAHRVSYASFHGVELSPETLIRHTCDNPPCVNPAHLLEGTHQDNSNDAVARRRNSWGVGIWTAKLTPTDIPIIRSRLAFGEVYADIAADFDVSRDTIRLIDKSRIWKRVP